jgi:hypothetical protein
MALGRSVAKGVDPLCHARSYRIGPTPASVSESTMRKSKSKAP